MTSIMLKFDEMINTIQKILSRTNLSILLDDCLKQIVIFYEIGSLQKYEIVAEGYEDANIKIYTSKGIYIVKLYNKDRTFPRIQSIVRTLSEFRKIGVPVTELVLSKKGNIFKVSGHAGETFACITKFFSGKNLIDQKITIQDILIITKYLAKINTLNFPVAYGYDSWGITNVTSEFEKKKSALTSTEINEIKPVMNEFKSIALNNCSKSVIHGDMQKQHVLKDYKGNYCILDLGCLNFDISIIDLAIFIAEFCIDYENPNNFQEIYNKIIKTYTSIKPLSNYELSILPIFIQVHYVVYLFTTLDLIRNQNDHSKETKNWFEFSKKGLELSRKWFLTI